MKKYVNGSRLWKTLAVGLLICLAYLLLFGSRYQNTGLLWADGLSVAGICLLLAGLWLLALNLGAFSSTVYSFRRTRQVLARKPERSSENSGKEVPDSYAEYDAQRKKDRKLLELLLTGAGYLGIGLLISALL